MSKNLENLTKTDNIEGKKSSNLLNELRNFNEIFIKNVTCDNIKSHKKPVL